MKKLWCRLFHKKIDKMWRFGWSDYCEKCGNTFYHDNIWF